MRCMIEDATIICPYCGYQEEPSFFPDFVWEGEQGRILKEMQSYGFNVVTCGDCGDVILLDEREEVR